MTIALHHFLIDYTGRVPTGRWRSAPQATTFFSRSVSMQKPVSEALEEDRTKSQPTVQSTAQLL